MGKKQINVVSLTEFQDDSQNKHTSENENHDEQELNQIKEEIQKEEALNPQQEEELKPKPKRKPPTKKIQVVEVAPTVVEPINESSKKVKTLELVSCPLCQKQMTKRTLRYDHSKTCPGQAIDRDTIPVKKRTKDKPEIKQQTPITIPEEIIEREVNKRISNSIQERINNRMKVKDERIKKLASQIA